MSKRFFDSIVWDKSEFLDSSEEAKLLFFYTIMRCNNIGIFDISLKMASFQLGFEVTKEKLLRIPSDIEELSSGVFWLPNFCFYQYGILKDSCPPHRKYISELKKLGLFERVVLGYQKGIETLQEKEEEKEKDKEEEKEEESGKKQNFVKPDIEEISGYCRSRNNGINPDKFFDFYESKGWLIGKNKMKDWKAAVRTWEKGDNQKSADWRPQSLEDLAVPGYRRA